MILLEKMLPRTSYVRCTILKYQLYKLDHFRSWEFVCNNWINNAGSNWKSRGVNNKTKILGRLDRIFHPPLSDYYDNIVSCSCKYAKALHSDFVINSLYLIGDIVLPIVCFWYVYVHNMSIELFCDRVSATTLGFYFETYFCITLSGFHYLNYIMRFISDYGLF